MLPKSRRTRPTELSLSLVVALELIACGGREQPPVVTAPVSEGAFEVAPPKEEADAGRAPVGPFVAKQVWHGAYTCPQGPTELWIRVVRVENDEVDAVFEFSHAETNAFGSYRIHGTWDGRRAHFEAGDWLRQPEGYVTVDLEGTFPDPRTFRGRILAAGCTTFVVKLR
jgi:hypothetical protein